MENYEQKYKAALGWVQSLYKGLHGTTKEDAEHYFPELKESEGERIREEIVDYLRKFIPHHERDLVAKSKEWIAWLEKQGERKPIISYDALREGITQFGIAQYQIDNWLKKYVDVEKQGEQKSTYSENEPKFEVGDWCIDNEDNTIFQITKVLTNLYHYRSNEGKEYSCTRDSIELDAHLWTIEDAKDGDVLCSGNPFIFRGFGDKRHPNNPTAYCGIDSTDKFILSDRKSWWTANKVNPATKEQCELLFSKMKEAGYEWDSEKKELREIPNALEECEIEHIENGKYYYCIKDYYSGGYKKVSKGEVVQASKGMSMMGLGARANEYFIPVKRIVDAKPEWSEEDEKLYNSAL